MVTTFETEASPASLQSGGQGRPFCEKIIIISLKYANLLLRAQVLCCYTEKTIHKERWSIRSAQLQLGLLIISLSYIPFELPNKQQTTKNQTRIWRKKRGRVWTRPGSKRTPSNTISGGARTEILHPRGQNRTSTTNRNKQQGPVVAVPTWKREGEKFCPACQPASAARAVEKEARIHIALQGVTHAAHNGSLCAVCKQCAHSAYRGFSF